MCVVCSALLLQDWLEVTDGWCWCVVCSALLLQDWLEVTDGWFAVKAALDDPLKELVVTGRLRVGDKIVTYGAELTGVDDGCPPLQVCVDVSPSAVLVVITCLLIVDACVLVLRSCVLRVGVLLLRACVLVLRGCVLVLGGGRVVC